MLYVVYTNPARVKFSEYIAHFLVRATSPKKARALVKAAYPKHPIDIMADYVDVAALGRLRLLAPCPGKSARSPLYFCDQGHTDEHIRLLAAELGSAQDSELWKDPAQSAFHEVPANGRAQVLARTENRTPAIAQVSEEALVFCWRVVGPRWPNPDEDPISPAGPTNAGTSVSPPGQDIPPGEG